MTTGTSSRRAPPTSTPSRASSGARPRGVAEVAHRCPCGEPDVLRTEPRLPDGTPFPTTYYATCPRLTGRGRAPSRRPGVMREMTERLGQDADLAAAYRAAHEHYLAQPRRARRRAARSPGSRPAACRPGSSACTCSSRTRSPAGPGVNPLGDEALAHARRLVGADLCAAGRRRGAGRHA